jgi:hypothetical protein
LKTLSGLNYSCSELIGVRIRRRPSTRRRPFSWSWRRRTTSPRSGTPACIGASSRCSCSCSRAGTAASGSSASSQRGCGRRSSSRGAPLRPYAGTCTALRSSRAGWRPSAHAAASPPLHPPRRFHSPSRSAPVADRDAREAAAARQRDPPPQWVLAMERHRDLVLSAILAEVRPGNRRLHGCHRTTSSFLRERLRGGPGGRGREEGLGA